jgi:hypothetical protein
LTTETPEATFQAVELGQAMISMSATDSGIPLGTPESIDLASVIQLDAMSATQDYVVEKDMAFRADGADQSAEPVFHATVKINFRPSAKDQREELYELLNKATTKKAQAMEKLRQTALAESRQAATRKPDASAGSPQAVKAGFLNKSTKKEKSGVEVFVEKWFGPESIIRQLFPVAKNYIIFFAAAALFHYKGDALSLPPPV